MQTKLFRKILIANRGEIAVRVIRACRELGIQSVAVYSEADRRAMHVRLADEAVAIGPAPARESYLEIETIIRAAKETGAEAIHPGYGFLSENAAFARAVQDAELVFIGPPPDAIDAMGDKGRARARMQESGVPVVPGYQGIDDDAILAQKGDEIGYPLLVKAAAGGGGKGMRVVNQPTDLTESIEAARREAVHAFGDGRLILERYIPRARHIEFQVLADGHGNVLHIFERECSVQRRHQKIIEECPSPLVDEAMRARMGKAAVTAAKAVGYTNAGTIEFIVDPETREFFFLEMNTRLQVEHPVTEMVSGLDLVHWQIRVAAGERLPFSQSEIHPRGHAMECRLYAEDPANSFLPASGPVLNFIEPRGPCVRVDAGYAAGDAVSMHYDPLIAKIITWGEDRATALRRMQSTLRDTVLLGLTHNGPFLQDVLASEDFQAGRVWTTWVEEQFGDWQPPQCALPPEVLAAAALASLQSQPAPGAADANGQTSIPAVAGVDAFSPWRSASGFRVGG